MNSADHLDFHREYPNFPEFQRHGIDLSLTHALTILELQAIRNKCGFPVYPGGYQSNWGRTYGSTTSEHYAVHRLATAGDVFPARGRVLCFWTHARNRLHVRGLGLYLDVNGPDGKPWVMVHFDLRDTHLFWIRDNSNYTFWPHDPVNFWRLFYLAIKRDIGE